LEIPPSDADMPPQLPRPPRSFTIKKLYFGAITSGSNYRQIVIDSDGNSQDYDVLMAISGPTIRVRGGMFMISANVTDGHDCATIVDNVVNCPLGWDANQDENGIEIVNGLNQPVFQLFTRRYTGQSAEAVIFGVFSLGKNQFWAVSPDGTGIGTDAASALPELRKFQAQFSPDFPDGTGLHV
jgi:hypothetical protein